MIRAEPYWNPLVPELSVSDLERSLKFYQLCGFSVRFQRESPRFAYLEQGGAQLMIEEVHEGIWQTGELEAPLGRGINLQIEVDDVNTLCQRLLKNDIELFKPIQESWYQVGDQKEGQLEFLVQDPDGYLLRFVEVL